MSPSRVDDRPAAPLRVLALEGVAPQALEHDDDTIILSARYAELCKALLEELRPALVLAPLVGDGFDGLDIARRLSDAGYGGRFRAVVPSLPNPDLVRREIAAQCPGLDIDLVMLAPET